MRFPVSMFVWVALFVAATVAASFSAPRLQDTTNEPRQLASAPRAPPDRRSAVLRSNIRIVLSVALEVLAEQRIPVSLVSRERGVIRTGSVSVSRARLRELTTERFRPAVEKFGSSGGRYVLQITVTPNSLTETSVKVDSLIILKIVSESAQGGQALPSSMRVETEFLQRLAAKLRAPR